jgi:hypothetical protein
VGAINNSYLTIISKTWEKTPKENKLKVKN